MIPDAHVSHQTPQRLRVKIPSRKGDPAYFAAIRQEIARCGAVDSVEVNPLTGSVLLTLNSDAKAVADFAQARGLFRLNPPVRNPPVSQMVLEGFDQANESIKSLTGGDMDIPEIVFLALMGAGIYQISIGNLTAPAWYTAFWYASNLFVKARGDAGPSEESLM